MAGSGRKTFSPGDVLTSSDVQNYLMDQSVMVFAGTAERTSAIPSPSAGMVAYSTATSLQVYNGSAWVDLSTGYGVASGTAASSTAITVSSVNYTLLTFTADSNLVVSKAGLFDVLMFGGGSSGGYQTNTAAVGASGGGGAGGMVSATVYLSATTYPITIGAGGTSSASLLGNGLKTSLGTVLVAVGGGVGYGDQSTERCQASQGGCGGGGGRVFNAGGVGMQGFNGGSQSGVTATSAGGGGGVSAVGGNTVAAVNGGAGGAGFDVSAFVSGGALFKGGGGGGAGSVSAGAGGSSVGGAGSTGATGNSAAANTASGGGGAYGNPGTGGSGGSGIFYIRYRT
jgi:hypothetical protein